MGAEVALADPDIPWDTEEGCLGIAQRIADERGGIFLNQFQNPANPKAHETTAAEIYDALGDSLDVLVVGVGTGRHGHGSGPGPQAAIAQPPYCGCVGGRILFG